MGDIVCWHVIGPVLALSAWAGEGDYAHRSRHTANANRGRRPHGSHARASSIVALRPASTLKATIARQATAEPNEPINLTGPPEPVLYRMFLEEAALDGQQLQQRQAAGGDTGAIWSGFSAETGLTQAQSGTVLQVASDFEAGDRTLLAQERGVADDWHKALRAQKALGGSVPPPPLAAMNQIQQARDRNAMEARAQLHTLLGDDAFESMEIYIHSTYGHAKVLHLPLPPHASGGGQ